MGGGEQRPDVVLRNAGGVLRSRGTSARRGGVLAIFSCAALLLGGCTTAGPQSTTAASYVGEAACARCHPAEAAAWRGSHHDLAMQTAADSTVLGDFHDAEFRSSGMATRFFREDGRFMVRTDGPDGALADFEIQYTFGVFPLQQYLIGMPGGRLQALGIAWDARPKSAGGARWFSLHPGERVTHDDVLHWTRWPQNWNLQCAACHSTNLHKNYDAATHSYHTTWSELDVSCEACHGPGSRHVALASRPGAAARRAAASTSCWTSAAA